LGTPFAPSLKAGGIDKENPVILGWEMVVRRLTNFLLDNFPPVRAMQPSNGLKIA
jgi:hypothetical protein